MRQGTESGAADPVASEGAEQSGRLAEHYRLLAENAADLVLRIDSQDRSVWVSPSLPRLTGWAPEEWLGGPRWDLLHPDDHVLVAETLAALRSGGPTARTVELRLRHRHGTYAWWSATARRVRDDPESDLVVALRDIDDEVHQRHAAHRQEALRHAALDAMLDPFALLEPVRDAAGSVVDFGFLEANPATEAYEGRGPGGMVGLRLTDLMAERSAAEMIAAYAEVLDSGVPLVLDEHPLEARVAVGRPRLFDIRAAAVEGCVSLTWRDVTDRAETQRALAESRDAYRLLAENASDVVSLVDPDGVVQWVSPSVARLGHQPETVVGHPAVDLVHPDDRAGFTESAEECEGIAQSAREVRLRTGDGSYRWFRVHTHAVAGPDGAATGRVAGWQDIDAERSARVAMEASEQRFRTAMLSAPVGMAVLDLDGDFVEVNAALCRMLGRDTDWLLGHRVSDLLDARDAGIDSAMRSEVRSGVEPWTAREHRMLRSDGEWIWIEHSIGVLRDAEGEPTSYVSQFLDVTQAHEATERLRFLASHDSLTELINRRELLRRIEAILGRTPRTGANTAILFIDLDNLKPVNDTRGHAAGDAVIAGVARRLGDVVRADDVVARFGGDEFVVVLPGVGTLDDAERIAAAIHDRVAAPVPVGDEDIRITLSIGLALVEPGDDPQTALRRADDALYEAKQAGRNRTVANVAITGAGDAE